MAHGIKLNFPFSGSIAIDYHATESDWAVLGWVTFINKETGEDLDTVSAHRLRGNVAAANETLQIPVTFVNGIGHLDFKWGIIGIPEPDRSVSQAPRIP